MHLKLPKPFRKGHQVVENASAFPFFHVKVVSELSLGRCSLVATAQLVWALLLLLLLLREIPRRRSESLRAATSQPSWIP